MVEQHESMKKSKTYYTKVLELETENNLRTAEYIKNLEEENEMRVQKHGHVRIITLDEILALAEEEESSTTTSTI